MTRRIVVTLCAALASLAVGVGPALADSQPADRERADWACVGIDHIDYGMCQQNPLPDRLPVPDEARVLPPEE